MSSFAFMLLCVQACLIQNVFSQHCYGARQPSSRGIGPGPAPVPSPVVSSSCGSPYGGVGCGDVDVTGDLPVSGVTVITGHVPVLGAVNFSGEVPAGGKVSINGNCGCNRCCGSLSH